MLRHLFTSSLSAALLATPTALAQPGGNAEPIDWASKEAGMLTDHLQLTSRENFLKAGEAYFNPDSTWIIFQAIPVPDEGESVDRFYSMYVAKLVKNASGDITGIEAPIRVSPPGSYNTCGWFHPTKPGKIIFGSTLVAPTEESSSGYQRGTSRYRWSFPSQTDIVTRYIAEIVAEKNPDNLIDLSPSDFIATPVFERPGYDAECAYSPDGRHMVFASVDPETGDADLFIHDFTMGETTPVVVADGYDGGPFFSPDGKSICYRSDRVGNDLLQIFTADLAFDESGSVTGVKQEHQHTDNRHVNWAPFYHPSGEFLVYATSEVSHRNYEVFAIPTTPPSDPDSKATPKRITHADGFDGLPVFNPTGEWMMWTSQRGEAIAGEQRPSSQLWVARVREGLNAE